MIMPKSVWVFSEGVDKQKIKVKKISSLIEAVVLAEELEIGLVNVIFCNDGYLLTLNQNYLDHNTLTDTITFDYCEDFGNISGDIFISYERIKENARIFRTGINDEINRVVIHGVLHLCGYKDKTEHDVRDMRNIEDHYLKLFCSDVS